MHKAVERKHKRQADFLAAYQQTPNASKVCDELGVPEGTFHKWRGESQFRVRYDALKKEAAQRRAMQEQAIATRSGLLFDDQRDMPPKGSFAEWRVKYIGRQVEEHQREVVQALEDRSNLIVITLLPPGAGKDTTAGDWLLYEVCDNRELRSAWIMKGESFARRRLSNRLDPYLTDRNTYRNAPPGASSVMPTGNLLDDYGPYKFKKGMVDRAGQPAEPTIWTQNEMYFLKTGAPEADPNLWATGMQGQLYGSRIDLLVMSDVFDRENQKNPTARADQLDWVFGTALSRLDESGRLIVLGTRVLPGDNYEEMIAKLVGDAPVIHQGRHYTKYANGVAVVIVPAIERDDEGEEQSYWPGKFAMDDYFDLPDGSIMVADGADQTELVDKYKGRVERKRGLRSIRDRNPNLFNTMYQQAPPDIETGDFTDIVLNAPDDDTRTVGVYRPRELIVVGADPARTAGAAWVAWGVDRERETITVVDSFFGTRLGTQGIKSRLVVDPIAKYNPVWYCYEVNREEAVLDDPEIQSVFRDFRVNMHRHRTHSGNRGSPVIGVPSMSFYMRSRTIRFPAQTAADREQMGLLKDHFRTWDRKEAEDIKRAALKGLPDDLAMAAWVGFIKALELLEKKKSGAKKMAMPVPQSVMRKWERMQQRSREQQYIHDRERTSAPSMRDVVSLVIGGDDGA